MALATDQAPSWGKGRELPWEECPPGNQRSGEQVPLHRELRAARIRASGFCFHYKLCKTADMYSLDKNKIKVCFREKH